MNKLTDNEKMYIKFRERSSEEETFNKYTLFVDKTKEEVCQLVCKAVNETIETDEYKTIFGEKLSLETLYKRNILDNYLINGSRILVKINYNTFVCE